MPYCLYKDKQLNKRLSLNGPPVGKELFEVSETTTQAQTRAQTDPS